MQAAGGRFETARAARRQISSSTTLFVKFLVEPMLLAAVAVASVVGLVASVRDAIHGPSVSRFDALSGPAVVLLLILLVGGPLAYLFLRQARLLKEVSADEDFLYVSNFRREIRVPLSEIDSVRGSFRIRGKLEPITVSFRRETEFGRKIVFIPPYRLFGVGLHPLATQLGALVVAKGGGRVKR